MGWLGLVGNLILEEAMAPWDGEFCLPIEAESTDGDGVRSCADDGSSSLGWLLVAGCVGGCFREKSPKTISANHCDFGCRALSRVDVIGIASSSNISLFPRRHAFVTLLARAYPLASRLHHETRFDAFWPPSSDNLY